MNYKKTITMFAVMATSLTAIAQTPNTEGVSISSGVTPPHPSAMLDVSSSNKGVLIPRVALRDILDQTTISSPAEALLVYNDGTYISSGFYYWDGAKWVKLIGSAYPGVIIGSLGIPNDITIPISGSSVNTYTGANINLPPGRWAINVNILISTVEQVANTDAIWVRSTFSDSPTGLGYSSGDIEGNVLLSGALAGPSFFGLCVGVVIVNNTTSSTKTYYYWAGGSEQFGAALTPYTLHNFGTNSWGENQIYAVPIN